MHKLHVAVLRGGPSSEYDVSLKTGASVLKHLPEKYKAFDILISKDGTWHRDGLERTPDRALTHIDVVFNALHGEYGEDGKVQKILDHLGIPYTGSGSTQSAIGMNKILTKKAFAHHGIRSPYHTTVSREDSLPEKVNHIFHHFLLPVVVKPSASGSSVGVTIVKNFHNLEEALKKALAISEAAIVEEYIKGKEATCGVVDNMRGEKTYALLPVEIIHPEESEFFDYHAKYSGKSREIVPGNFSDREKQEIMRLAKHVHNVLDLRHYSRTDFMVHPRRGVYVLEVNTLPGLTSESLLPKSLEAVGMSYPNFLDHILTQALEKNK